VARAGGLLAVAVIPGIAGIAGPDYAVPATFNAGFRTAIVIAASLLVAAAALAFTGIRPRPVPAPTHDRILVEQCTHCPITGPPLHPSASTSGPPHSPPQPHPEPA
jgi:hypothetical protein